MCKPFSCIVTKDRRILRHSNSNVHSHRDMIREHKLRENIILSFQSWVRVELIPPLLPELDLYRTPCDFMSHPITWKLFIDEQYVPSWFEDDRHSFEKLILDAAVLWWKKNVRNGCYQVIELHDRKPYNIISVKHLKNGLYHRKNKPATIRYYANGKTKDCEYYNNGQLHRKNEPTIEGWNFRGYKEYEYCYYNGKLHRDKGPAQIEYTQSGKIKMAQFYHNGTFIADAIIDKKNNKILPLNK